MHSLWKGEIKKISRVNWELGVRVEGERGVEREATEEGREYERSGKSSWRKVSEGEQGKRYLG